MKNIKDKEKHHRRNFSRELDIDSEACISSLRDNLMNQQECSAKSRKKLIEENKEQPRHGGRGCFFMIQT